MIRGVIKSPITGCYVQSTGRPSLFTSVPSCVFDLDATQAASYGGSGQLWSNLVSAPADGSAKSAYDFMRGTTSGADTADPTFVGPAGSPSAYWTEDGGDRFTLAGANTAFLNALHKTTGGTPWWIAACFRVGDESTTRTVFGTNSAGNTLNGIRIGVNSSEALYVQQGNGAASKTSTTIPMTAGTDYCAVVSFDGTGTLRTWLNAAAVNEQAYILNTATADANNTAAALIGFGTGFRGYALSAGKAFLTGAQAATIRSVYASRHGRAYA